MLRNLVISTLKHKYTKSNKVIKYKVMNLIFLIAGQSERKDSTGCVAAASAPGRLRVSDGGGRL